MIASGCFSVLLDASECFRVLPSASECFRWPRQVLKYDTGQFYRTHHDQNSPTTSAWGPRMYTFFMYLNDAPGGGATHDPRGPTDCPWPRPTDTDTDGPFADRVH